MFWEKEGWDPACIIVWHNSVLSGRGYNIAKVKVEGIVNGLFQVGSLNLLIIQILSLCNLGRLPKAFRKPKIIRTPWGPRCQFYVFFLQIFKCFSF